MIRDQRRRKRGQIAGLVKLATPSVRAPDRHSAVNARIVDAWPAFQGIEAPRHCAWRSLTQQAMQRASHGDLWMGGGGGVHARILRFRVRAMSVVPDEGM